MKKLNLIGLDVSLDVCKAEGYGILDTTGDKAPIEGKEYKYLAYWPEYDALKGQIRIETFVSWPSLMETYQRHKEGIDSFSDDMPERMLTQSPSFYDILCAADTISGYCGLD